MDENQKKFLSSGKWSVFANVANEGILALVTVVLAALLSPADYGIVGLAYIYISLLQVLSRFGFNTALIQRKELFDRHLSSVFWLNLGVCLLMLIGAALSSPLWASANEQPALRWITLALATLLPIQGLTTVQEAILKRDMAFKSLALRTNTATAVGGVVGVATALLGFGAWALVLQQFVREMVALVFLWRLSKWRPTLTFSWTALRELFGFAFKSFLGQLGIFFQHNVDGIVMALYFGPAALGIYRFNARLIEMVLKFLPRAMQMVSLPHFSKLQDDHPELLRNLYFGSRVTCAFTIPLFGCLAGFSHVFLGALGTEWLSGRQSLQVLCVLGAIRVIMVFMGPTMQAVARPGADTALTWVVGFANVIAVCLCAPMMTDFALAEQVTGIALLRLGAYCILLVPVQLWLVKRAVGVSPLKLFRAALPSLVIAACIAAVLSLGFSSAALTYSNNFLIPLMGALSLVVWYALLRLMDNQSYALIGKLFNKVVGACLKGK